MYDISNNLDCIIGLFEKKRLGLQAASDSRGRQIA